MSIDVIALTRSYPKSSILLRRIRAALSGRPYCFNRQRVRHRVFREINAKVAFENYVETGTYLGMTTHFLSVVAKERGAQVHSCEISDDYYGIASRTVGDLRNVHLSLGNSVDFLRDLSGKISDAVNFVYLDAHWYDYLPLKDELSVLKEWSNTIVMIDDFKVPGDENFGWDKYDDDREICLRYIDGNFGENPVYFPNYPAREEGDEYARGYCVIPMSRRFGGMLDTVALLKKRQGR
jgi:predicted O-methyltransferase YrrM